MESRQDQFEMLPKTAAAGLVLCLLVAHVDAAILETPEHSEVCADDWNENEIKNHTFVVGEPITSSCAVNYSRWEEWARVHTYEIEYMSDVPDDPEGPTCNYSTLDGRNAGIGMYWNPLQKTLAGTPSVFALGHCTASVSVRQLSCDDNGTSGFMIGNYLLDISVFECSNASCNNENSDNIYYCDQKGNRFDNNYTCVCLDCHGQVFGSEDSYVEWYITSPILFITLVILSIKWSLKKKRLKTEINRYKLYLPEFKLPVPDKRFEIDPSELSFDEHGATLGEGQFGKVYKGTFKSKKHRRHSIFKPHRNSSLSSCDSDEFNGMASRPVAIKMCNKSTLNSDDVNSFLAEALIMKKLSHNNIIQLVGEITQKRNKETTICIVLEYCEGGDLLHYLQKSRLQQRHDVDGDAGLCLSSMIELAAGVARGIQYLHETHKIVHRDLAARNCLVAISRSGSAKVKISDFGLSREIGTSETIVANLQRTSSVNAETDIDNNNLYISQHRDVPLPIRWMAPESLTSLEFSFPSDIWSLSVVLFEIFTLGDVPYETSNTGVIRLVVHEGRRLKQPHRCPDSVYSDLMLPSWSADPNLRPTASEALRQLETLTNTIESDDTCLESELHPQHDEANRTRSTASSTAVYIPSNLLSIQDQNDLYTPPDSADIDKLQENIDTPLKGASPFYSVTGTLDVNPGEASHPYEPLYVQQGDGLIPASADVDSSTPRANIASPFYSAAAGGLASNQAQPSTDQLLFENSALRKENEALRRLLARAKTAGRYLGPNSSGSVESDQNENGQTQMTRTLASTSYV